MYMGHSGLGFSALNHGFIEFNVQQDATYSVYYFSV